MPGRTTAVAFLGNDADLNRVADRVAAKLRETAAIGEETNAKMAASADVAGKKFGDAFEHGTTKAGSALTKLGSTASSWGVPFAGSLEKMGKQFDEATSKSQKFASAMASAGKLTLAVGLTSFAAAAFEGVKGAAALQKQMEMLHTQAGATQQQVGQLTKGVLNMAGSVGTGPQTLAQGMYHVVSSLNATLPAATRASTEMNVLRIAAEDAKVGNANLVDVTNALDAAVVSGVNGVQNFGQAMGVMNATVGAGDMTMQDLADAFGTGLLAKAKTAGLSIRDVGAAAAVLGDNNIRGANAGTLLGSTFRIMSAPSAAAAKALSTVNLGALQLANDMRSGGLIKALTDLKTHLVDSGATASQQALVLERAFGGRQSTGVQVLLGQLDRLKAKYADVSSGGKNFGKDYQATTHTLSFQTDQLKATVQALADKFGLFLIPKLEAVGHAVSDVIAWFEKHKAAAEVLAAVITSTLGAAVGLFVTQKMVAFVGWMGQGVSAIGKFATSVVQGAGTLISKFTSIGAGAATMETEVAAASTGAGEQMQLFATETQAAGAEVVTAAETTAAGVDAALGSTGVGLIVIGLGLAVTELATHWQQAMTAIKSAVESVINGFVLPQINFLIDRLNNLSSLLNTLTFGLVGGGQIGHIGNIGGGGGHGGKQGITISSALAGVKNPGAKGVTTGNFTTNSFAAAVLAGLGAPQTAKNLDALVGWIQREGNNPNIDKHNPLDTTLPEKGSFPTNSAGVQSFPSWAAGLKATIATLEQQNMGAILASLKAGLGLSGAGVSAALSAWSGGGYSSTPMANLGNAAIQKLLGGSASGATGHTRRQLVYANPLPGMTSVGRTDQGVDFSATPGSAVNAIGAGRIVDIIGNWFKGQPLVEEQLTGGPDKGKFVYYAEQLNALVKQGQAVQAGQRIGTVAQSGTGLELGFGAPGGRTLAAATTGYTEGEATPAGKAFAAFMKQIGQRGLYESINTKTGAVTGGGSNIGYTIAQLTQAFYAALQKAGDSILTKLGNAIQSGTVRTLGNALGASTGGKTSALLNRTIEALGPTANFGQISGPGPPDTAGFAKTLTADLGKIHAAGMSQLDHDLGVKHGTALSQLVADLTALHGTALAKIEGTLAASHSKPMQQLGKDLKAGPGSLPSLTSILTKGIDASQQGKQFEMLIASLVASGQKQLAARLVSEHKAAIATLAQEMYAEQVMKDGESLNLQATMLRDQTQLQANADAAQLNVVKAQDQAVTDRMNSMVTAARDMTQIITDRFAAMAQQVEDSMQAMADAANAVVTGINDQTQIQVDILGERGLYGLNLVAQKLQVQSDQTKAYWDQQIALAQKNLDSVTSTWHAAVATAQLNLDQVTLAQDQYVALMQGQDDSVRIGGLAQIAAAQAHSDAVTLHEDTQVVGPAQIAVDLGATLPKAQQDVLNAQLRRAQGEAGVAEGNAGAALESVTNFANHAIQNADDAYANAQAAAQLAIGNANQTLAAVQGEATLMIDNAKNTLQSTQDSASIAEAGADSAVAIMKQTASTEFAGSGAVINIYGIPANDAAAIGDEVQWAARTLIPAV